VGVSWSIAVLSGGASAEREVSLNSGENVAQALRSRGHRVQLIDLRPEALEELRRLAPDCVFIALHGRGGEDGSIQGALELMRLPYTGSGILASALAMDKAQAKTVLRAAGLPTPEGHLLEMSPGEVPAGLEAIVSRLGFPLVVKPAREGSTIGLSVARDEDALRSGLDLAAAFDRRVILERFVPGMEVTVAVLQAPDLRALPPLEIESSRPLYDYEAKYTEGGSRHIIPARLPAEALAQCEDLALRAHGALGCRGMSRVDMIVHPQDGPRILEVNTIPGLTRLSLLPDAARAVGIPFEDLVEALVREALDRERQAAEVGR
jgi:D-alanine-D-alanine ligase